jgi:DNA-binding transcriptional regulator YiaG
LSELRRHPVLMERTTHDILDLAEAVRLARTGEARAIRLRCGVNAGAIGAACGVSASAITRWESGERRPTGKPAIAWVRLLREITKAERRSQ